MSEWNIFTKTTDYDCSEAAKNQVKSQIDEKSSEDADAHFPLMKENLDQQGQVSIIGRTHNVCSHNY